MRRPSDLEIKTAINELARIQDITVIQARVIYDTLGYQCFGWQVYAGDVVITAKPQYRKQINGFRGMVSKYAHCGEIKYLESDSLYAFLVFRKQV